MTDIPGQRHVRPAAIRIALITAVLVVGFWIGYEVRSHFGTPPVIGNECVVFPINTTEKWGKHAQILVVAVDAYGHPSDMTAYVSTESGPRKYPTDEHGIAVMSRADNPDSVQIGGVHVPLSENLGLLLVVAKPR